MYLPCTPPCTPLIFLVFELQKWPWYQKCFKMFKLFEFLGPIAKFCILQALTAFKDFAWKKNRKKEQKLRFSSNCKLNLKHFILLSFYPKFNVLSSPNPGEHFWYPHDIPNSSRTSSRGVWNISSRGVWDIMRVSKMFSWIWRRQNIKFGVKWSKIKCFKLSLQFDENRNFCSFFLFFSIFFFKQNL